MFHVSYNTEVQEVVGLGSRFSFALTGCSTHDEPDNQSWPCLPHQQNENVNFQNPIEPFKFHKFVFSYFNDPVIIITTSSY